MKRKKIGEIGVDGGQAMVCDPCYIESEWKSSDLPQDLGKGPRTHEFSYDGCCRETLSKDMAGQLNYKMGHAGAGVAFSTGWGDGVYPVYATYNEEGRIVKVEVLFDEE